MVLANYVPCISQEVACIAGLRTHCLMSWANDSSLEEEDDGQAEEEDDRQAEEEDEWEEDPADIEEQGEVSPEPSSSSTRLEQGEME